VVDPLLPEIGSEGVSSTSEEAAMADAEECWRQAAECARLSQTDVTRKTETIMLGMARSWISLANQMERLDEHDPVNAAHLALAR
jgi:hypothetical protein